MSSESLVQWGLSLSGGVIPTGFESERAAGSIIMRGMVIDMNDEQLQTLAELQAFLDGTVTMEFTVAAEEREWLHRAHGPAL